MTIVNLSVTSSPSKILLDAAFAEFAEKGYLHADLAAIAERAGCDQSAIDAVYVDKKQLYLALLHEVRNELITLGGRAMSSAGTLEHRIHAAWQVFFRYAETYPCRSKVLTTMPFGILDLSDILHASQEEATRALANLLLGEPGLLPDDDAREEKLLLCMEFIRCGMHGLARWWVAHPETSRDALVETISAVAWRGLAQMGQPNPGLPAD